MSIFDITAFVIGTVVLGMLLGYGIYDKWLK